MKLLTLLLLLFAPPAVAEQAPENGDVHEYRRLSAELHRLAARDTWSGVERAYTACLNTRAPMTLADHLAGAHAAAARGDVASVRERLLAANAVGENREVIEWLYTIDTAFGAVDISSFEGALLEAERMPFEPRKAAAVAWARDVVAAGGTSRVLLPEGAYWIGLRHFEVVAGAGAIEVEASEGKPLRRSPRNKSRLSPHRATPRGVSG